MNSGTLYRRETLLMRSGTAEDQNKMHLFVVLTDPFKMEGSTKEQTLLVSISSVRERDDHDKACILHAGDHPFIKYESYVVYRRAQIEMTSVLIEKISEQDAFPKELMSPVIFEKICKGLQESKLTRRYILDFYQKASARHIK